MKTKLLFIIIGFIGLLFSISINAQENSTDQEPTQGETVYDVKNNYKDFRFAIGGGYAHRLGKILDSGDKKTDDLSRDLRGGFNIDAEIQYFFKEAWGLGLNINYASASVSGTDVYIPGAGTFKNFKETNRFIYVGPMFSTRYEFNQFLLILNVGIGPMFFNVKDSGDLIENSITKVAFASQVSASIEYKINNSIGIGLKTGFVGGSVKIDGLEDRISASNFIIGGFISFRSW